MNAYELVIKWTKKFETTLVQSYGAEGRGLTEKIKSVEQKLPRDLFQELRRIAHIRNCLMHEDGFEVKNLEELQQRCERAFKKLDPQNAVTARKALQVIDRIIAPVTGPDTGSKGRLYAACEMVSPELAADLKHILSRSQLGEPASDQLADPENFRAYCQKAINSLRAEMSDKSTAAQRREVLANQPNPAGIWTKILIGATVTACLLLGCMAYLLHSDNQRLTTELHKLSREKTEQVKTLTSRIEALNKDMARVQRMKDESDAEQEKTIYLLKQEVAKLERRPAPVTRKAVNATPKATKLSKTARTQVPQTEVKASQTFSMGSIAQSKKEKDQALANLRHYLFESIRKDTKVTLGKAEYNVTGNKVDIVIPVTWQMKSENYTALLNKYFKNNQSGTIKVARQGWGFRKVFTGVSISRWSNSGDKIKLPYTESLYDFMASQNVVIRVRAGNHYADIPITGERENFGGRGRGSYCIQVLCKNPEHKIFNQTNNPLIIKGIPIKEAEGIKSIRSEIVIL